MPPFGPTMKIFEGDFMWKGAFFAVFQQELQNSTMFDGLFSYRYNMRLKSPCEIASDTMLWSSAFPNFRKKWANLRLPLNVQKQKVFQLQGGFAPLTLDQGLCPGPRWGLHPQTPVIGSRSARSPCPPLPNPKYATGLHPRPHWGRLQC